MGICLTLNRILTLGVSLKIKGKMQGNISAGGKEAFLRVKRRCPINIAPVGHLSKQCAADAWLNTMGPDYLNRHVTRSRQLYLWSFNLILKLCLL